MLSRIGNSYEISIANKYNDIFTNDILNTNDIEKLWKNNNKFKPKVTKNTRNNLVKNWHYHIKKLLG